MDFVALVDSYQRSNLHVALAEHKNKNRSCECKSTCKFKLYMSSYRNKKGKR